MWYHCAAVVIVPTKKGIKVVTPDNSPLKLNLLKYLNDVIFGWVGCSNCTS
jgi:hypothetical protein